MGTQVIVILGNPSVSPKGKPSYLQGIAGKTIQASQTYSDTTTGTLHLKWLPLVVAPQLVLSYYRRGGTDTHRATWNKLKFLAFLVGLSKWTPGTLPPLLKTVNIPQ